MAIEEHQQLLEKVLETINCPVCFKILQPTVSQCVNGHGICGECRSRVSNCPTCRENFSPYQNTLLNQLLELFPHECKFKDCQEFVKSRDDHEKWCGYRPTKCKLCAWNGCGKDILAHIKTNHTTILLQGEKNENNFWTNFNCEKVCNVFTPISAHGQFFWLNMTNNTTDKKFIKKFLLVPNGKVDCTFQIRLVFKNSKTSYVVTIIPTHDSLINPGENDNSFTLHTSVLREFINSEQKLIYSLYIEKINV